MIYKDGDEITFRNGDDILIGWVEGVPVYDNGENVIGYVVSSPQFQGIVRASNIIEEQETV